jgi:hypothetical protein
MSRYRPGERDVQEMRLIALCEGRAMTEPDFVAECQRLQRLIDRIETPRLRPKMGANEDDADGADQIDRIGATGQVEAGDFDDDGRAGSEFAEGVDWQRRAVCMTGLATGLLRQVCAGEEARPKLRAVVGLLAIGASGCPSMREIATAYSLTPERISQLVEQVQKRFNLPKNHHNKSAAAVESYRRAAELKGAA